MSRPALLSLIAVIIGCSDSPDVAPHALVASEPVFYDVGVRPRSIAVADLNGDRKPDAAVATAGDGKVSVLFGDGTGGLGPARSYSAGKEPSDVDAVDLGADGSGDLVFANHESSQITVLRNYQSGVFAEAAGSPFLTGARPHLHGLASGDFNGDGLPDVTVESSGDRSIVVLPGTSAAFDAPARIPVQTMPYYRLGVGNYYRHAEHSRSGPERQHRAHR